MMDKTKKEFASVVGHELRYAGFNLFNKAKSFFWSIFSGGDSHSPGNPDGEYATTVGNEVNKNYYKAKKAIKDEEEK